ncbi:MAG: DUF11 domain-containing protein [Flavobacteriales bacterium]|nr:DUF11 domain-containing protein [Flavobacteriales bacterium]
MTNKLSLITTAVSLLLLTRSTAQLVFVPDVELRTYLDSVIPGVVDANGYIDSSGPLALATQELTINCDWSPADITGVEAFTNLEGLHLMNTDLLIPLTVSAFPPNLMELELYAGFSIDSLPPFPAMLSSLRMAGVQDLTVLPPFPASLNHIALQGVFDLPIIPLVPDTMDVFALAECGDSLTITNMPNLVNGLSLSSLHVIELPPFPERVTDFMVLNGLPDLVELPPLPGFIGTELLLYGLSLIDSIAQLPDSCPALYFDHLMALQYVGPLPNDLMDLDIFISGPQCLPILPSTMSTLNCYECGFTCVPNLPAGMSTTWTVNNFTTSSAPVCNLLNTSCERLTNAITGRVYADHNANGSYDPGEAGCPLSTIQSSLGNSMSGVDQDGRYAFGVVPGAYAITCPYAHPYATSISPAQHTATFADWDGSDTLNDFVVTLQPNIQDLVTDITHVLFPVPGFDSPNTLTLLNSGTQPQDVILTFSHDVNTTFVSSTTPPDIINGNTLTWNFMQLGIGEQRTINLLINTSAGTSLGTIVTHTLVASPVPSDQTPTDNSSTSTTTVVSSWDPNDKTVSPTELTPAEVSAGERVAYTVRFQNTGTYQATRVVITDTLSSDLQWNTVQLIAASHAHTWYIENGVLFVVFDNINLPDSNANEPESHGFVKFSMKPVSTLMLGASVSNTANIYFDFNEPVITNAAVFTVDDNTATIDVDRAHMQLSPNPVSDALTVIFSQPEQGALLEVVDVTGRVVLATVVSGTQAVLDVQALRAGSYHVRLGDRLPGRFVKR